ncbi:MAG TPA: hypothetical protein VHG28_21430 [Longimicrobiaceae bacterium]|nr:hypothetical protein [Longimicrobiaceae bacterium]
MATPDRDPPFEEGSQPVSQAPDPVPGPGRSVGQIIVIAISVLAVLAAIVWFFR